MLTQKSKTALNVVALLAAVKQSLKIDTSDEDTDLTALMQETVDVIEKDTNVDITPTIWEWTGRFSYDEHLNYHDLPCIVLPRGPLVSINAIHYYDREDTLTAWTEYYLSKSDFTLGFITPQKYWPHTSRRPDAVVINFTTGYSSIPLNAMRAIKLQCGTWHEHREGETEARINPQLWGFDRLLSQIRMGGY